MTAYQLLAAIDKADEDKLLAAGFTPDEVAELSAMPTTDTAAFDAWMARVDARLRAAG